MNKAMQVGRGNYPQRTVAVAIFVLRLLNFIIQEGVSASEESFNTQSGHLGLGEPFVYAGVATNLRSWAVYNKTYRSLQLNVSWAPPTDTERQPQSYNLHVFSINTTSDHCQPSSSAPIERYYQVVPMEMTSVVIPQFLEAHIGVQAQEIKIKPECSYRIVLESNPHNGTNNTSLNYTVPECVSQLCSCRPAKQLPEPRIISAVPSDDLRSININWTFTSSNDSGTNISRFIIAMGNQLLKSNRPNASDHHLYNMSWVKESLNFNGNNNYSLTLPARLEPNFSYRVEVTVVDGRLCSGPTAKDIVHVPFKQEQPVDQAHPWLVSLLPSLSFVVLCCLALAMVWQRCTGWIRNKLRPPGLQPIPSWQGVYKAVSSDSGKRSYRSSFPSMQERNVIYVEKEIEDAKARGEADMYEVSHDRLEFGREIGKGAFGRVFLARAEAIAGIPGYISVAVKKLKHRATEDEVEEFLSEIAMLKQVGRHPNIVTMLGCCTIKPPYCMLMEYLPCGDLLQYLRRLRVEYERKTGSNLPFITTRTRLESGPSYLDMRRETSDASYIEPDTLHSSSGRPSITETEWSLLSAESEPGSPGGLSHKLEYVLDPKELQDFAAQIARGMAYLEKKQITHRDLAARNILMDGRKTLKISDFGLSRSGIYVNTRHKKVPLRWLSLEAMRDNLYSSKSDVWAYAIVLWEIGTLGGFPYPTVSDYDLLNFLAEGKRLEKPDNCTEELYSLMRVCWSHSADLRPSFHDIVSHLDSAIGRRRVYVDFSTLRPDYVFPPTEQVVEPDKGDGVVIHVG